MFVHYYISALLILLPFSLFAKDFSIYDECDEYYDSRGFYHNECDTPKPTAKEYFRAIDQLDAIVQPKNPDANKTEKKSESSIIDPSLAAGLDDVDINQDEENNKALKEQPEFQFGRESQ